MQRNINVSTEVYAAIWGRRQDGEETEDAILRRELGLAAHRSEAAPSTPAAGGGIRDVRNNIDFPEGFVIFRNYKGQQYEAVATNGAWVRKDNGKRFPTINQLNWSIAAGNENVWNGNWKYRDPSGSVRSIAALRP